MKKVYIYVSSKTVYTLLALDFFCNRIYLAPQSDLSHKRTTTKEQKDNGWEKSLYGLMCPFHRMVHLESYKLVSYI